MNTAGTKVFSLALAMLAASRAGARTAGPAGGRAHRAGAKSRGSPPPAPRRPCCRRSAARSTRLAGRLSRWTPAWALRCKPRWSPERPRSPSSNSTGSLKLSDLSAAFVGNLSVIQPLYTFGKIATRQEAAAHGLRAREAQTRMQRSEVAFEVARIYEGYLLARDADRFLAETIHWLESTLESTQDRLAQGAAGRHRARRAAAAGGHGVGLDRAQSGAGERGPGHGGAGRLPRAARRRSRSPPPRRSWSPSGASRMTSPRWRRWRCSSGRRSRPFARARWPSVRWRAARRPGSFPTCSRWPSSPPRTRRGATGSRPVS